MQILTNKLKHFAHPNHVFFTPLSYLLILSVITSCSDNSTTENNQDTISFPEVQETFGDNIDLDNLLNYENQTIPNYITKDNGIGNPITDEISTLGRVLFYDVNLSVNNAVSCATCHIQEHGFSDPVLSSSGVNGLTARHSMRLVNARFSNESKFFWDERALSLETQTTMPIKDHGEMGFSGQNGDLSFNDLLNKLGTIGYYNELFNFAFGSNEITEYKIQIALSQFVRSIQSFDSRYDEGRLLAPNDGAPFINFTPQENLGKNLFLAPPQFNANGLRIGGGIGCAGCHVPPEFSIDPNSLNNGIVGVIGTNNEVDLNNTKSPTLRDLFAANGNMNGPFMHNGVFNNLHQVVAHYNNLLVFQGNSNIDPRLTPLGNPQILNLTPDEIDAVVAFLRTLSGQDVYSNPKWSNPF